MTSTEIWDKIKARFTVISKAQESAAVNKIQRLLRMWRISSEIMTDRDFKTLYEAGLYKVRFAILNHYQHKILKEKLGFDDTMFTGGQTDIWWKGEWTYLNIIRLDEKTWIVVTPSLDYESQAAWDIYFKYLKAEDAGGLDDLLARFYQFDEVKDLVNLIIYG